MATDILSPDIKKPLDFFLFKGIVSHGAISAYMMK
jgi:hypothetical protein